MLLRDTFGDFFNTIDFKHLFSSEGKPAEDPARIALIIILQFAEQLSDERMADAVRSRIDFKYLLALPLDDPAFDSSVLCEFRTRLIEGNAELLLFEKLLSRYVGLAKTCLQHLAMASALNLMRMADWLAEEPRAVTRLARFERVMLGAA
jgi:transposase